MMIQFDLEMNQLMITYWGFEYAEIVVVDARPVAAVHGHRRCSVKY